MTNCFAKVIDCGVTSLWTSDVNANCHSIFNLKAINCVPVKNLMQNPAQSDLDMNGYKIFDASKIILGSNTDNGTGAPIQITVPPNTPPITVNGVPVELPKDITAGPNITVQDSPTDPTTIVISAIPSGVNGNIQFNGSGLFAGSSQLNWLAAANTLDVNGNINLRNGASDTYFYSINGIPFARLAANRVQVEFLNVSNLVTSISPGNLSGAITLIAGANVSISQSGQNITIASTGGGTGSSQWIDITGGGIYYAGGHVGIGTATPQFQLDVTGDANITGLYRINGIPLAAFQVTNAVDSTQSYANPVWITTLDWSKIINAPPGVQVAGSNTQVQYNNNGAFGASPNFTWDNSTAFLTVSSPYSNQSLNLNSTAAPDANTTQQIAFQKPNFNAVPLCLIQANCSDVGTIDLDIVLQPDGGGTAGTPISFRLPTAGNIWAVDINGGVTVSSGTSAGAVPDANTANSHLTVGDTRIGTTYGEVTVYGNTNTSGASFGSVNFANYARTATEKRMGVISGVLTSSGSNYGGMRFQTMVNQTLDPIGIYMTPSNAGTSLSLGIAGGGSAFNIYRTLGQASILLQTSTPSNDTSQIFGASYSGVAPIGFKVMGLVSRGTISAPTPTQTGDVMLQLEGWGNPTTSGTVSCYIQMIADGNWTSSSIPSAIVFSTTLTNAIVERMRITSAGRVGIGTSTPQYTLDVVSSSPDYTTRILGTQTWCGFILDHTVASGGESLISFRSAGVECAIIEYDSDEDRLTIFSGARDAANSAITCDTNSRVGILTTNPAYQLDVLGDCNISGVYRVNGVPIPLGQTPWTSNIDAARFQLSNLGQTTWVASNGSFPVSFSINGVGNATFDATAANGLNIYGSAVSLISQTGQLVMQASGTTNGVNFRVATVSASNALCVTPTGNVGIGNNASVMPDAGTTSIRLIVGSTAAASTNPGSIVITSNGTGWGALMWANYDLAAVEKRLAFIQAYPNPSNNNGNLAFYTMNAGVTNQRMVITSTGNVGIGINPIYTLDVANTSGATQLHLNMGGTDDGGFVGSGGANSLTLGAGVAYNGTNYIIKSSVSEVIYLVNGGMYFNIYGGQTVGSIVPVGGSQMVINTSGVGILSGGSVYDSLTVSGATGGGARLRLAYGGFGSMFFNDGSLLYFLLTNNGDPWGGPNALRPIVIGLSNGFVGIATNAAYQFHVGVDSAAKPSTNTWTISSDIRTKQNVQRFEGDINVIRRLNPTVSEYNGKAQTPKGARVVSFDPDELKAIVPQCVTYVKGKLDPDDEKETDLAGINTHEIFFHLLRAVQDIDKRLSSFENLIKKKK